MTYKQSWGASIAVTAAALAALALAGCSSGVSRTSSSTKPTAPTTVGPGPMTGEIDSCLVGKWVATSVASTFSVTGAYVTLHGGAGLKLTFAVDGSETADWSPMVPLSTTIPVDVTETYHGRSHYLVTTADDTLTFVSADYSGWSGQENWAGQLFALTGENPIPAEQYSCTPTTLTEQSGLWQATFRRV